MGRKKKDKNNFPKGTKVNLKGTLKFNELKYVDESYIGQMCTIDYEDTTCYKCHFEDGFQMWINKYLIDLKEVK